MKKRLDVSQKLTDWHGRPIEMLAEGQPPIEKCRTCGQATKPALRPSLLSDILLNYINAGEGLGLSSEEQLTAFGAGVAIAGASVVELEIGQWNVIKKLCDGAKEIYGLRIKVVAQQMVDGAETMEV